MNNDMRKLILSMLACMMTLGAMAQSGKFTVKGTFDWVGDSVFFSISESAGQALAVTGDMLEVSFDLEDADFLTIGHWFKGRDVEEKSDINLPAMPGETLVVSKDENGDLRLSGSQFYVDYNEVRKVIEPIDKESEEFVKTLREKLAAGVSEDELADYYQQNVNVLLQKLSDAVMGYIKAHPDQDASAALIAQLPVDVEYLEPAVALLSERVRNSAAAGLYRDVLEKAQWVIIDFWGSWCGWCIKGMPKMKEYYAKYQDKLEILGVDCNDTVEKWKAAVAKHELPWLHVYCDKEKGDNPLELYNVDSFPTKIILDPEGKVAKVIVGESAGFYDYLDEVLK